MEKILLIFIVNPNAGRKKGSRIWKKVERFLVRRKIEYEWYMTVESGDAKKIAANLTSGISYGKKVVLVVIGGDGTINEVVSGIAPLKKPPQKIFFFGAGFSSPYCKYGE